MHVHLIRSLLRGRAAPVVGFAKTMNREEWRRSRFGRSGHRGSSKTLSVERARGERRGQRAHRRRMARR